MDTTHSHDEELLVVPVAADLVLVLVEQLVQLGHEPLVQLVDLFVGGVVHLLHLHGLADDHCDRHLPVRKGELGSCVSCVVCAVCAVSVPDRARGGTTGRRREAATCEATARPSAWPDLQQSQAAACCLAIQVHTFERGSEDFRASKLQGSGGWCDVPK